MAAPNWQEFRPEVLPPRGSGTCYKVFGRGGASPSPTCPIRLLSERLKRLEREGLLVARPYSERPPRAAYQLTAEGRELAGALRLLAAWGAGHADPAQAPVHQDCGTPVEARWYCPTCDRLVEDEPQSDVRYS